VEFDGISESTADWHRECVLFMRKQGWLGKTLISQDSGWYRVGEPGGGRESSSAASLLQTGSSGPSGIP
jgi:phosphotriesterase-related protein